MTYAELFHLSLRHPFYADGLSADLRIETSEATRKLLGAHRAVVKPVHGGLRILVPLDDDGRPFLPLAADAVFLFHLVIEDSAFALRTDLTDFTRPTGVTPPPTPRFTNQRDPGGPLRLVLPPPPSPEADPTTSVPPRRPGVFADVEIVPRFVEEGIASTSRFEVPFRARRARWAYYVLTDLAATNGDDLDLAGSESVTFRPEDRRELDQEPDPADRIAVQLARRFPELRRIRFLSDELVECRELPGENLELRRGGQRVAGPLPTPSIRNHSTLGLPGASTPPQDSWFQIVQYLTTPFPQPGE